MNPYPPIDRWRIPDRAIQATLEGVRPAGGEGREAGAFWLGARSEEAEVRAVVFPKGNGVIESPYQWQVSPEVMAAITRWSRTQALVMLAMLHIHLGPSVRMSWSDRNRVIQVPDILSLIVGDGGGEANPARWGWYVYDTGKYRELAANERTQRVTIDPDGTPTIWIANADSVKEMVEHERE